MKHEEIMDRLSDYLDDELVANERRTIVEHLTQCRECQEELARYRLVESVLLEDAQPPTALESTVFAHALLAKIEPFEIAFLSAMLGSPRMAIPAFVLMIALLFAVIHPRSVYSYGPVDSLLISQDNGRIYAWLRQSSAEAAAGAVNLEAR